MNAVGYENERGGNRKGIAGLFLVLVLGVGALIFLLILSTGAYNPFAAWEGTEADRYSDPNAQPWKEGHLFIRKNLDAYEMGGRRPPFPSQPELPPGLRYHAKVYAGASARGEIDLTVATDGDAWGTWAGEFELGGRRYKVTVQRKDFYKDDENIFNGNTAPLKIYEDERGIDKSKLYVITSGPICLKDVQEEETRIEGAAYITCWISKDLTAEGKLAIPPYVTGEEMIFKWGPVEPAKTEE